MAWPEGVARRVLAEVDSTNAEAARIGAAAPGPLWLLAHRQTAARGRQGRAWAMPEGNLAATLLLPRPGLVPMAGAQLSFAAALAVAELAEILRPGAETALKWPNDVLLRGAEGWGKLSGILLESAGAGPALDWLAIGIGVNLGGAPAGDGPFPPIALGSPGTPEAALEILATRLEVWRARHAVEGFGPIRTAWLARAHGVGRSVTARTPRESVTGRFADMDATGTLILNTAAGVRRIAAADVFFPE